MCDDIDGTLAELKAKGVSTATEVSDMPWGRATTITIADGVTLGLYQPTHPTALHLTGQIPKAI